MKFLSLTLSLLISNCLAADNSSSSTLSPKPKINTSINELKNYIDITTFHFVELRPKQLSVEEASKMSLAELDDLEKESERWATEASTEKSYVHTANAALAKLLKKGESLPATLQAAFDAWKNSRFSASKSLDFFSECLECYSSTKDQKTHCQYLFKHSLQWHHQVSSHIDFYGEDSHLSQHHTAQQHAIDFIYCGLKRLNGADRVVFNRFIREGTLQDIRDLAKKVVSSGQYPEETVDCFIEKIPDNKYIDADRIILLGNAFGNEIRIARSEEQYVDIQKEFQVRGTSFDLNLAIDSKDPNNIVKAYEQCITNSKTKKFFCTEALRSMWDAIVHKQKREHLSNKISNSADTQCTELLKKVVEPAIILLNSKRIVHEQSYEGAVMEKCRDYVEHKDDFEYIRKDYEGLCDRSASLDKSEAYRIAIKIVQELEKHPDDQKCSFDLTSNKLICKSPKVLVYVKRILENEIASKILKEFFDDVISKWQSHSTAIDNFVAQAKNHWLLIDAENKVISALDPSSFF